MNIEALLRDRDWVSRLARSLARDDAQADDLAQDGWLAALRSPPGRAVRAWWRSVLRRRAMEVRREEDRRAAREGKREAPRPVGPELLERLELEQAVAQAVGGLPEHYRDVILLRYFEELPPRAIAKRLNVPVETVRTRLKRAHELLRERLLEVRRDWRSGMLLLAWPGSLLGGLAVETKKIAAGAVVLCLLLLSVLVWRGAGGNHEPKRTSTARGTQPAPAPEATPAPEETTAPDARAPGGAVFGVIAGPLPVLEGTEPLVVVRVLRGNAELASGRFPPGPFRVEYERAANDRCVAEIRAPGTRLQAFALPSAETDLGEIRFYQALLYGGRVLDLEGNPIPGAIVRIRHEPGWYGASEPASKDGGYRIDLDEPTNFPVDRQGNLAGPLLDVRVQEGWLGPYYASPAGFRNRHDLRVDLAEAEPEPVLRIVSGGQPVVGVRVGVHEDRAGRSSLGDPFATGVTGEDGCVCVPWRPDLNWALATIERPEGTVYASLLRDELNRPVHEIDVGKLARVAVEFVLQDGKPAEGARVGLHGTWRPDTPGKPVSSPRAQSPAYEPGAVHASLYGIVPRDGIVRWSFPVEQPEAGSFTPTGWFARLRDGRTFLSECAEFPSVRPGDGPVRVVLEPSPADPPFVRVRFRDGRGPVRPERAGLRILPQGAADSIQLGEELDGVAWCLLPSWVSECLDASGIDTVEIYVGIAGRPPATAKLPAALFFGAVRDGTDLTVEIDETRPAAFRIARPNGEPARNVLLTLVPEPADHITAGHDRLQAIADDAGGVVLDCRPDLAYAVVAFDLATGEGARIDDFRAGGAPRDLVLETPRRTRVRVVFPDGAPAPKAGVQVETRPRYLAPVLYGIAGEDGWAELPRVVPGIFVLDITACDRRLMRKDAEGRPQLPMITHSMIVPMASVDDGDTVTVPMRDDVARWVAEGK